VGKLTQELLTSTLAKKRQQCNTPLFSVVPTTKSPSALAASIVLRVRMSRLGGLSIRVADQ
jgi:hypothetical protein